ncbi:MAG: hypothetical protein OEY29_00085 [Gammaproteobacteria bacterium]|nr:hypothetical protein [Gammaproteobacteria bacterium]
MSENGAEKKYIILFAILIVLTGFTFESQSDNMRSGNTSGGQPSPHHHVAENRINKP